MVYAPSFLKLFNANDLPQAILPVIAITGIRFILIEKRDKLLVFQQKFSG